VYLFSVEQDQRADFFFVVVIILNIKFQANVHGLRYILCKIIIFKSNSFPVNLEKLVAVAPQENTSGTFPVHSTS
jgi:hypothetical protein